ncbi:MAG: hypothetical protein IJR87_02670 [Bacteroidaceae bacterium]|nr:hypothetical protein [Bacteroidaceae bacterium]
MEENINMTAERSLEIITQQIEQSRRTVSKTTGQSLYIAGICIMCTAVLVAAINLLTCSYGLRGVGHLLWFLLPVVIWQLSRRYIKNRAHTPVSLVGSMVAKTWKTFGYFAIGVFAIAIVWSLVAPPYLTPDIYVCSRIRVAPVIVLLMGMAISVTGHILRQRWLVTFGIVAGLLCFAWEHFEIGSVILMRFESPDNLTALAVVSSLPCITIFIFGLVGLLLPGLKLKNQSL